LLSAVVLPLLLTGFSELARAETAYANGDYARAAELYSSAAGHLPWRTDLWERAGLAAGNQGHCVNAVPLLERAPGLSAEGWLALGRCHYLTGDLRAAQHTFEQGLAAHPAPALYAGLALVHRSQKNWAAERGALQSQLEADVDDPQAHYRLGLLLAGLDREEALAELTLAASLDPAYAAAVKTLRAALDLAQSQPDASQQMVTLGRALGLVQEWDLALTAFEAAIELNAENAEAWAWLAESKQQTGREGRGELDKALMLNGQSAIVRAMRGLYWNRQGKYAQSLAEYLLAAGIEPANPAWRASIGEAYAHLGDLAAALGAYRKATELAPDQAAYWHLLAIFCVENNAWVEEVGLPAAQKAAELAPDDVAVRDTLGWSYLVSGRYSTAEQILLEAISLDPDYLPAHLHLGWTYLSQGNQASALDRLVYVRDADPEGESGKLAARLLAQYFP